MSVDSLLYDQYKLSRGIDHLYSLVCRSITNFVLYNLVNSVNSALLLVQTIIDFRYIVYHVILYIYIKQVFNGLNTFLYYCMQYFIFQKTVSWILKCKLSSMSYMVIKMNCRLYKHSHQTEILNTHYANVIVLSINTSASKNVHVYIITLQLTGCKLNKGGSFNGMSIDSFIVFAQSMVKLNSHALTHLHAHKQTKKNKYNRKKIEKAWK